jgi:cell division protein FtsB
MVAFAIVLVLAMPVLAVHTVEELYQQGEQTNSEIVELRKSVDNMKVGFEDTINSVGVRLIIILVLLFIVLNCVVYLGRIVLNYWNRQELKKHRDWYVASLEAESNLLKRKISSLEQETTFLSEAHNHLLNIVSFVKPEHPFNRFLVIVAISSTLIVMSLYMSSTTGVRQTPSDYVFILPILFAGLFFLIAFKVYRDEIRKYKSQTITKDLSEVTSTTTPKVDVPPSDELKKPEKPTEAKPNEKKKSLLDKLKALRKQTPTKEEKAKEKAEPASALEKAGDSTSGQKLSSSPDSGSTPEPVVISYPPTLPEGAELRVKNGLVSLTAPITEEQKKRAEEFEVARTRDHINDTLNQAKEAIKKMDLPNIDDVFEEEDKQEKVIPAKERKKGLDDRIMALLKRSNKPLTAIEIRTALGLNYKNAHIDVGGTLLHLRQKKLIKASDADGKKLWRALT